MPRWGIQKSPSLSWTGKAVGFPRSCPCSAARLPATNHMRRGRTPKRWPLGTWPVSPSRPAPRSGPATAPMARRNGRLRHSRVRNSPGHRRHEPGDRRGAQRELPAAASAPPPTSTREGVAAAPRREMRRRRRRFEGGAEVPGAGESRGRRCRASTRHRQGRGSRPRCTPARSDDAGESPQSQDVAGTERNPGDAVPGKAFLVPDTLAGGASADSVRPPARRPQSRPGDSAWHPPPDCGQPGTVATCGRAAAVPLPRWSRSATGTR